MLVEISCKVHLRLGPTATPWTGLGNAFGQGHGLSTQRMGVRRGKIFKQYLFHSFPTVQNSLVKVMTNFE